MSENNYHTHNSKSPSISKSGLDLIADSPARYKLEYIDGIRPKPTRAMVMGTACHTLILEPEKFDDQFAISPKVDRRTKVGKAIWAEFVEANEGKEALTQSEWVQLAGMSKAVRSHPLAMHYLGQQGNRYEEKVEWLDDETGARCKCRPDLLAGDGTIVDLKTTSGPLEDFWRSCVKYRYHVQDSWYSDGVQNALGIANPRFVFLVVRKQEFKPHDVAVFELDDYAKDEGWKLSRRDLKIWANCMEQNHWPGYDDEQAQPELITFPSWAFQMD